MLESGRYDFSALILCPNLGEDGGVQTKVETEASWR